jgi:hypothetical protein
VTIAPIFAVNATGRALSASEGNVPSAGVTSTVEDATSEPVDPCNVNRGYPLMVHVPGVTLVMVTASYTVPAAPCPPSSTLVKSDPTQTATVVEDVVEEVVEEVEVDVDVDDVVATVEWCRL